MKPLSQRITVVLIIIMLTSWLYYESLPNFHIQRSFVKLSDSDIETTLDVTTYKMFNNPELYQEIADEHNRINGTPSRLEIRLYWFGYHYRTVVFEYEKVATPTL